jgi:hypothetical protein
MVSTRSSTRLAQKPVLQVPLDVCGIIIDILASNKLDPGLISVKKCSLVSQSFLPLCRKHIFATIKIDDPLGVLEPSYSDSDEGPHHVLEEFMQLIKRTPEIGNYIRHLELCFEEGDELDDFPRTMQCLTRLESLAISQFNESLEWRNLKWPIRNALLRLMHLPTLTALTLRFIHGFLVTDLVHGINLRRLKLKSITFFEDSADEPPTAMILPAKLVQLQELSVQSSTGGMERIANARRSDGLPVIDPTQLTTVSVMCNCVDDMDALRTFLKQSEQLIKIDLTSETSFSLLESFFNYIISVPSSLTFVGFGDMIAPHIRALKIISLSISVFNNRVDPLGGLPGELATMAGENVLERLKIIVNFRGRNDKSEAEWGMLDAVLTSSGWPALKAVFLTIRLFKRNGSDVLVGSFRQLKKTQFPRLSASKSVDFRFRLTCQ